MEKKNQYEYVDGKILDVNEIEIEIFSGDSGKIARIKLKTNEGVISYKPYKELDELSNVQGYKIRKRKRELCWSRQSFVNPMHTSCECSWPGIWSRPESTRKPAINIWN